MNVKFISMNYENSCVYLCFCCVDAVDCGAGGVNLHGCLWIDMDRVLFCSHPALWILDQVQYDGP